MWSRGNPSFWKAPTLVASGSPAVGASRPPGRTAGPSRFLSLPLLPAEPAVILEKPEPMTVMGGNPFSLECKVAGTPELFTRWLKDGRELRTDRKYQISFFNNVCTLRVLSAGAVGESAGAAPYDRLSLNPSPLFQLLLK
uniref:Ig-like domain-containing protein n=1 Tax=Crocodylus porosus TaxID=8502 RepID=A0A7M4F4P0_CROPO